MSRRRPREAARTAGRSAYRTATDVVLTGIVVIVPLVVTLYVLNAALDVITSALNPVIKLLRYAGVIEGVKSVGVVEFLITVGIYRDVTQFLTEIIALLLLTLVIVAVGAVAHFQYGERLIDYFDWFITRIPGVGTIYNSFRRMGDVMLESGAENFRDVKLVEFPHDDVYVLGFVTNQSPSLVEGAAPDDDLTTLFLPLAPNPVMGGFLAYFPDERVRDIDMTVEQAVRTVITSGIATESPDAERYRHLSGEELSRLNNPGTVPMAESSDPSEKE